MKRNSSSTEERVYQAYWQDGSIDLFAGLGAACIGIAWILDWVVLGPLAPVLAVPIWSAFRHRWIESRLGHVRFDESRRSQLRRAHVVLIALGCGTLLLGVAGYFTLRAEHAAGDGLRTAVAGLPGALLGIAAVVSALQFGIARFALYGLAFLFAGAVVALLGTDPGWALLVGGLVATAAGSALLLRFFQHFPLLPSELN